MSERMLQAVRRDEDGGETSLRPQTLAEFIGQAKVCSNLKVFIEAARTRYAWGLLAHAWGDADVARTQIEQAARQLAASERTEELDAAVRRLEELPPPRGLTRIFPVS